MSTCFIGCIGSLKFEFFRQTIRAMNHSKWFYRQNQFPKNCILKQAIRAWRKLKSLGFQTSNFFRCEAFQFSKLLLRRNLVPKFFFRQATQSLKIEKKKIYVLNRLAKFFSILSKLFQL